MKDIDRLTLSEIESLLGAARRRKAFLANRRPPSVIRKKLVALAASHGYAIDELFVVQYAPAVPARRARKAAAHRKVPAKYRDPANRRDTWSGRGRIPRWLADKVRRGERVADYLIPGLARPSEKNVKSIGRRTVYKT